MTADRPGNEVPLSRVSAAIRWALAGFGGVVSMGIGLAAGELITLAVKPQASPYRAVGAFMVDHTPAFLREFAIHTFGTNDKQALMVGVSIGLVVLALVAGAAQVRRPPVGAVIVLLIGAFGVWAALTRPIATGWFAVPSVTAGVVAAIALILLSRKAPRRRAAAADDGARSGWSRRRFLGVGAAVGVVAVAGLAVARQVASTGGAIAERMHLKLPTPAEYAKPVPAGTDIALTGMTPFLTANPRFYRIDTALDVPKLTTEDWQLRIHGMVDHEVILTWDDLMALPARERIVTLTCVSNEVGGDLASTAKWLGYPMKQFLDRAGVHADADMLLATSVDGFTSGSPLSAITDGRDAMLAVGMNGEPLPLEHGYPVRQFIPGLYGFVSACKWVTDWEITRFDRAKAYWTLRGWGVQAPIQTASRIDRPAPLSSSKSGRVIVGGTAWAQHRGIRKVEVRVDDGPWNTATLATEYSTDTWRQWTWGWDAEPGQHTLYVRATDGLGNTQTDQRADPIPTGATGWHSRVVRIGA